MRCADQAIVFSAEVVLASKQSASGSDCSPPKAKRLKIKLGGVAITPSSCEKSVSSSSDRAQTSPRSVLEEAFVSSPGSPTDTELPPVEPSKASIPAALLGMLERVLEDAPGEAPTATAPAVTPLPGEAVECSRQPQYGPEGVTRVLEEGCTPSQEYEPQLTATDATRTPEEGNWRIQGHRPQLRNEDPIGISEGFQPVRPRLQSHQNGFQAPNLAPGHPPPQALPACLRGTATAEHRTPPILAVESGAHLGLMMEEPVVWGGGGGRMGDAGCSGSNNSQGFGSDAAWDYCQGGGGFLGVESQHLGFPPEYQAVNGPGGLPWQPYTSAAMPWNMGGMGGVCEPNDWLGGGIGSSMMPRSYGNPLDSALLVGHRPLFLQPRRLISPFLKFSSLSAPLSFAPLAEQNVPQPCMLRMSLVLSLISQWAMLSFLCILM